MPELNKLGEEGWELVHMEPVAKVGNKGDVLIGPNYRWSNIYFCVFKRRKPGSTAPVMPYDAAGQPAFPGPAEEPEPLPVAPRNVPLPQENHDNT